MNNVLFKWAVLLDIINEANQSPFQIGHTLTQKVAYLLQAALGVNVGYKFRLYHYGPYSEELWGDLRLLSDIDALNIIPDPNGYGYQISLGKEESYLELLATTHFVYTDLTQAKRQAGDKEVGTYVTSLKPHFTTDQVKDALSLLEQQGWIKPHSASSTSS